MPYKGNASTWGSQYSPAEKTAGMLYNRKRRKQIGWGQSDSRIVPGKAVKAAGGKPRVDIPLSPCYARQYRRGNISHTQRWNKQWERNWREHLEENLELLEGRIRNKSYKPKPARKVEIPKEDGKTGPLSICCYEDKLVQEALRLLNILYKDILGMYWMWTSSLSSANDYHLLRLKL